ARLNEVDTRTALACAQTWFQDLLTVIMSAILAAVRDRLVAEEPRDATLIGLGDSGPFGFGQPIALIDGERRQDLHARIEQHAVLDRPQQVVEPPIHAALAIMWRAAADRDRQHRAASAQGAFAVAVAPSFATMAADAICNTVSKDAIDPALQDGRHAEPPHRKTQKHGVGPEELLLFSL